MTHLNRDAIIGFIVIVIIGFAAVWYALAHIPVPATPLTATTTPSGAPAAATHITDHEQYFDVDAAYPSSTSLAGLPDSADVDAVALMKQWELDTIAEFKTSFADVSGPYKEHLDEENLKGSLQITYDVHTSARTVSYVYTVYEDTLGAHPNTTYHTFTFDTQSGQNLGLGDLFTSGSDYLGFLSTYSRTKLPGMIAAREEVDASQIDMDMLNEGTTADAANFSDFYLEGHTLVLLFPPYAVGPYVLGSLELDIPTSAVTGLKPEYQ